MMMRSALDDLTTMIPDGVLHHGDQGYAEAATTITGQGTPNLVVRPRTAAEVSAAVQFAGERPLPLTVRAGGHSLAGLTTVSDGVLLDLRAMHDIVVDPATRVVRIDGGATWGRVAKALQPHGLALTAGDTAGVGVGGLTLGGGIGWMVRRHGLAIDNLVGAQVVTADGAILEVSDSRHPDLYWALRGGGGNLGVVTRFDFVAQEVSDVVFGTVVFALDDPLALLTGWRDLQRGADDRLTTVLKLMPVMGEQPAGAMVQLCFAGTEADAAAAVNALHRVGTVLSSDVSVRPYASVLVDDSLPPGVRVDMNNTFLPDLSEAALIDLAALYAAGGTMVALRAVGGAFSRVPAGATAFAHRSAEVLVQAIRLYRGSDVVLPAIPEWAPVARRGIGSHVGFLSAAGQDAMESSYPAGVRSRLARIKATYDPNNVFDRTAYLDTTTDRTV